MKKECTLSNTELINKIKDWVFRLAESRGTAWTLSIPVNFNNDPDMLIMELCNRFEKTTESTPSKEGEEDAVAVLEWLADVNINGYEGLESHKIVLVDGEYYWESDTDGDQPIDPEYLYILFKQSKGTG